MKLLWSSVRAGLLLPIMASPSIAQPVLVSSTAGGIKQNGSCGTNCRVSDDGRYVAFETNAANLVGAGAANQIVLKDLLTGTVALISKSPAGSPANSGCVLGDMTRDGRYFAYSSAATNIQGGSTAVPKIYRYDRITDATELVSVTLNGAAPNAASFGGRLSDDGNIVLFESSANNLVPHDTNPQFGAVDVFVRDMTAGTTERMNVDSTGAEDPSPPSAGSASMSGDGRYVTFDTTGNWSVQDTNNKTDVYLRDRQTGSVSVVSVGLDGLTSPTAASSRGRVSSDGTKVVFNSASSNIVTPDPNGQVDVFIRNRTTNTAALVSHSWDLVKPCTVHFLGSSLNSDLSEDGRFVLFGSTCTNISFADTNAWSSVEYELYLHDSLVLRSYPVHVSSNTGETVANGSAVGSISKNGIFLVLSSSSTALSPQDSDSNRDIYLMQDTGFGFAGGGHLAPTPKPVLAGFGTLLPSSTNQLRLTGTQPGSIGAFIVSLNFQLGALQGGYLWTGYLNLVTIPFVSDAQGSLTLPFTMSPTPSIPGVVTIQALYADSSTTQGVRLTNAILATLR